MKVQTWTVVRFPNGEWTTGGRPDSPTYEHCEVWEVEAASSEEAMKKAQGLRARERRNQKRVG